MLLSSNISAEKQNLIDIEFSGDYILNGHRVSMIDFSGSITKL